MFTKTKIAKTGGIILLVVYAACILLGQVGSALWFIYVTLLVAVFFWNKNDIMLPLSLAGALPIAEFVWIGIRSNWFDQDRFMHNLKISSSFFSSGGFTGYIFWCVVIPVGVYKLYKVWMEDK